MIDAFICDAIRTPIGRYGGSLASIRADDLAALPLHELMQRNTSVDWEAVDDIILGNSNQAGEDNRNLARMASLLAGLPETAPASTLNRLCGSGMDAAISIARMIRCGDGQLGIAGGAEAMSRAPLVMGKATAAFGRNQELYDTTMGWRFVNKRMRERYGVDSMPETGENVAEQFKVSREDQDAFAYRSQQKAGQAQTNGRLAKELMTVSIPQRRGDPILFNRDEHPRPETSLAKMASLPTPFRDPGTVTAGNASGINDGAAAMLIASADAAQQHGLTPRARFVSSAVAGVEPRIMGIGPHPATEKALQRAGLELQQMDVIELNEAFAAQALAVTRLLGIDDDDPRVNPNGGAIALGHPLGMSGARLLQTATEELHHRGGRYALCTMCIGVGQGIATIIERV